jgi:hypothetical protein
MTEFQYEYVGLHNKERDEIISDARYNICTYNRFGITLKGFFVLFS